MSAFIYSVALQWKLDIRSKTLLVTCYMVPLLFFALMGEIFTSIDPTAKNTLIQSMTVMGISMGAMIGLPPSLVEIYGSDIKKVYRSNGIPLYLGVISICLSAFLHLMIMSVIIYIAAPLAFDAVLPKNPLLYFCGLSVFLIASLGIGCVLGLLVKSQSKLTMASQVVFLPSIMLSGIMFPASMLPKALVYLGKLFPASWGYLFMLEDGFVPGNFIPLLLLFGASFVLCSLFLKKLQSE